MLRYHVVRVFRLALLVVLAVVAYLIYMGYRRGSTETGDLFGYSKVLQFWSIIGPMLFLGVTASTPGSSYVRPEHDPFILTRPTVIRSVLDAIARWAALMAPVILIGIGASLFLSTRVPDAASATFQTVTGRDPVTVQSVWLVFLVGPVTGAAALLALSETVGVYLASNTLRIVLVGVVALMDATNRLRSPLLSPSGTALGIVQSGSWGEYSYVNFRPVEGPMMVAPSSGLLLSRVALVVFTVALLVGIGVLRARLVDQTLGQSAHTRSR